MFNLIGKMGIFWPTFYHKKIGFVIGSFNIFTKKKLRFHSNLLNIYIVKLNIVAQPNSTSLSSHSIGLSGDLNKIIELA